MNRRTLLLAVGAGLVIGLYLLDMAYRTYIEVPTQRYEGQLRTQVEKLDDANRAQVIGRRLSRDLEKYAQRSLPYDPELARSRYQEWLLALVERHQMQSASIDAENPRPIEVRGRVNRRQRRLVGYRITYSVRARTTLPQLTDFLHDFQRSAQLHKIRNFSLNPLVDGTQLDLSMVIEALTLEATERESELSWLARDGESLTPRSDFDEFVARNFFAKGFSKSLGEVRLNAITRNREGKLEAWFAVGKPAKTQRLAEGQSLDLPLHSVTLVSFQDRRVELNVNGLECSMELGQSLADVFGVEEATAPATSPSDQPVEESTPSPVDDAVTGKPLLPSLAGGLAGNAVWLRREQRGLTPLTGKEA